MFINYDPSLGFSANSFRNTGVSCGSDLVDFCEDSQKEKVCNFTMIETPDYYMDALSDGELLSGLDQGLVERLYDCFMNMKD